MLLIVNWHTTNELFRSNACIESNLILVSGIGIPRLPTRRVLHRLSTEFNLPVYVLCDNDTWGYFMFSVLKRGLMGPHVRYPFLAVQDLRYLGLRAGEYRSLGFDEKLLIPWKRHYDIRINHLRKYSCFRGSKWQREFSDFRRQHGGFEVNAACGLLGTKTFLRKCILDKLDQGDFLT